MASAGAADRRHRSTQRQDIGRRPSTAPSWTRSPGGRPHIARGDQFGKRLLDQGSQHVDVGHGVAVGIQAVIHAAVVRRHADRYRLPFGERHDRKDLQEPRAGRVQRMLRTGDVGDDEIEQATGEAVRGSGAQSVQGRRGEAGQRHQRVGSDRLAGLLVPAHGVADLRQPQDRIGLADREVDEQRRDPIAERAHSESDRTLTGTIARTVVEGVTDSPETATSPAARRQPWRARCR